VIPGQTYYFKVGNNLSSATIKPRYYDANKAYIGYADANGNQNGANVAEGRVISANCHYMRFELAQDYGTTYNHDICINISDPTRNGEYEPYWKAERLIAAGTLRGAGTVYDELRADAAVTRVGVVDLGSLTWNKADNLGGAPVYYATLANIAAPADLDTVSVSCAALMGVSATFLYNNPSELNVISLNAQKLLWARHAAADAAAFKAAMQGAMLTYALATPTTQPIDPPLNLTYKVDSNGTERVMVDETQDAPQSAPLPMDVTYGINLYESAGNDAASMASIESRVSTAETSIQQTNDQIALKANASDVYTKTQTDGLISTEVSNRNSAIEQSANAINLSVSQTYTTKTEFNALEVGGRNLLADTTNEPITYARTSGFVDFPLTDWAKSNIKTNDTLTLSFDAHSSTSHWIDFYWRSASTSYISGTSFYPAFQIDSSTSHYTVSSKSGIDIDDNEILYLRLRNNNSGHGGAAALDVTISNLKLEKGNKATDWTPAPEDMVSQTELESAKSEIKATTDGITSTVSKISSAKYLDTTYQYTLSAIRTYAAENYSGTWSVTDAKDAKVGDTVYLKVKDTTRNCYIYIKATVTAISGKNVTCTSHGYEDVLPVDTIKSTINQSSDSVKIQAKHVEIDGTAIFSNSEFKAAADAAYDSKGSAAAAQSAAEATAANDATSKANAAQSAAISAAATDATNKANAAQTAATNYTNTQLTNYSTTTQMNTAIGNAVDNLEIGGRNLLIKND
jgi:hypothetical protein